MAARSHLQLSVALVVVAALAGCASPLMNAWTPPPVASRAPVGAGPSSAPGSPQAPPAWDASHPATPPASIAAATTPPGPDGQPGTIAVHAIDLLFEPSAIEVPAAGSYELTLINDGQAPHDITFGDGTKIVAASGESATGTIEVPEGGLGFICSIPGHKDAGMTGQLTVAGSTAPTAAPSGPPGEDHGGPGLDHAIEADPNAPPPVVHDPAAPDLATGTVHEIELVMTERQMTVAEGYVQAVWTFGDTVPGPVLRVKVGDTIRIVLRNPAENQLAHSIDFHSSMVAWNDEMTSISPGEEKIYEWTADYAGVYMYHCGTTPTLHHIANGMYGMVIVEPERGLEPVEHEYALVQSEWYLGEQGQVTDLNRAAEAAADPDFVVFNGVGSQYVDAPIVVPTGERVRVFVLNAGPNVDSSFHIVGTIFDRVIKEGVELERGNAGNWGSQAMDLSPAQGGIVEFTLAEDGLYPIVTHAFNYVGRGALGLFQAGDGDPAN
jgi:nitrite reductase (NO-forming)